MSELSDDEARELVEEDVQEHGKAKYHHQNVPELSFFHHADALAFVQWYEQKDRESPARTVALTPAERENVIVDILRWKQEYEQAGGRDPDGLSEFRERLQAMPDSGLRETWFHTIGEWLASRSDVVAPDGVDWDTYVAGQFRAVCRDAETDYGYL